ncbi:transposon Tf2-6 polyprotein [Trichonephila clavipes]|nr:transposon Tf2-6 polyprotein [Trichonephila clavipes]
MNVPENELVYIDSVNENETKCAMKNSTDSNFKNVEMPKGSLIINCSTDKLKNVPLPFYVVNVKSKPILGLRGCKELKLIERIDAIECCISKNELIKHYKDVFTGVGGFPNEPYHITLKDNAVPVIHPPRRVPLALQPKLKNIISRLEGKKIFSVVDLKDGFWHVPLDEVSSEICTSNTPFGRYKFNKMPFGIVSAPEGRKVVVQSDHKPLMAIVKKPMHEISSRMILKLKYDFEINYVPGNQMFLADTLSRAFPVYETVYYFKTFTHE